MASRHLNIADYPDCPINLPLPVFMRSFCILPHVPPLLRRVRRLFFLLPFNVVPFTNGTNNSKSEVQWIRNYACKKGNKKDESKELTQLKQDNASSDNELMCRERPQNTFWIGNYYEPSRYISREKFRETKTKFKLTCSWSQRTRNFRDESLGQVYTSDLCVDSQVVYLQERRRSQTAPD